MSSNYYIHHLTLDYSFFFLSLFKDVCTRIESTQHFPKSNYMFLTYGLDHGKHIT